jgi:hypothetical protein
MKHHETTEIPREAWADYLNALSGREREKPVGIRVEGVNTGDQVLADHVPLVGISVEQKGSEARAIEVTVANKDRSNLTHMIHDAAHIYAEEGDAGEVVCLDIEDTAKVKTLIFFESYEKLPAQT